MTDTLRVGIVGCGKIARAHLRAWSAAQDVEIVSAYDVSPEAASALAGEAGARVAAAPEEMVEKDGLDAVSVCTPPACHLGSCRPFLRAGVNVLCEKPLEVNAAQAAVLAAEAEEADGLFMTAYCHRFHPPILELRKLIEAGTLGEPMLFRNIFTGGSRDLRTNHRNNPKLSGGGCLVDHGAHSLDLFRFLVGDAKTAWASVTNFNKDLAIEDLAIVVLETDGPARGEITTSYTIPGGDSWVEWYGTEGTAVVSYSSASHAPLSYRIAGTTDWVDVDCAGMPDRFTTMVRHFADCARSGEQPSVTAEDGLLSNRMADAAYESARTGRRQEVMA